MTARPVAPVPGRNPLAAYRPLPGAPDELVDANGKVRPAWRRLISLLSGLDPKDVAERFARGDQYLRDAGVFYRQTGPSDPGERAWPLSHVPVMLHETEWRAIEASLIQRAELLEDLAGDLYGPNRLVAQGHLPAALVAQNPEWIRPLAGVTPRGGHHLHFLAFEIGRGPDGKWWVLGDRTQSPSGAGFALENRVASGRVFPDLFAESNVHRLAGFFRDYRDALLGMRGSPDDQVGILTPGPLTDTYYEHAYIARYLGLSLVEGADLAIENGRAMVRTVSGLQPVSVLWRRMDSGWTDPLELNDTSRIGTPGLLRAVRNQAVTMVNAIGAGVLETRALMAFMPRICMALRGEQLMMPNIATWWCGQPAEREHVQANLDRMVLSPALSTRMPFEADEEASSAHLERHGHLLVGQEAVTLSTSPAWVDGKLEPRPMSLRVFLARTADGWKAMPGGYARIGSATHASAISMQSGGRVADVWITSDKPVEAATLIAPSSGPFRRTPLGMLPSQAADNLFWLGRYVERAETAARLQRAWHIRHAETGETVSPLLTAFSDYLRFVGVDPAKPATNGLRTALASALASAARVRDRLSVEGWAILVDISQATQTLPATLNAGDDAARAMGDLLRRITAFSGLMHDNMYRSVGWRFLAIGRALERTMNEVSVLAALSGKDAPRGSLELALEIGDSAMAHRRRHAADTHRATVVDLMAFDTQNPRSILFQLGELREHIRALPHAEDHGQLSSPARAALEVETLLAASTPDTLDAESLRAVWGRLANLSDLLASAYLK
jgi:uncharacterized circularly permuted ATP-grasp superfamily protein/uncharacterized alpha-E superfamily protein